LFATNLKLKAGKIMLEFTGYSLESGIINKLNFEKINFNEKD